MIVATPIETRIKENIFQMYDFIKIGLNQFYCFKPQVGDARMCKDRNVS